MDLKQKKAVALFYERSEYLLHGMGYEPIRLVSFWDYIYYRSYINTEYYFEETQSKEYKWWLKAMQKKKSEAKIKYPLQYDFRYNAILVGIRREQRSKSFLITDDFSRYDEFDDEFVVNEERWSAMIAAYIDDHIENFATIENE